MFFLVAAATVVALSCQCATSATTVDVNEIQSRLQKLAPAPQLLLGRGEETKLRDEIAADPQIKAVWDLIRRSADAMLSEPPVQRTLVGRRLLDESRTCLRRMTHLGMAYRLTGEQRYADRAKAEMLAAAAFADWNPSHFLDVAEMTAALAIGVDWMHDGLDEPTRVLIRKAIVEKGLKPSLTDPYWAKGENNWNQVCNAGMVLGALAVADEQRELAAGIIARAIDGLPYAAKGYAPDGAYPEGPMYWDYGTTFHVLLIAALQKSLGSDFGLLKQPGFERTGDYFVHVAGPTGLFFNYADAGQGGRFNPSPAMYYLAAWRNDPGLLYREREMLARLVEKPDAISPKASDRLLPLLLVWYKADMPQARPAALSYVGGGISPVALFRSSWDQQATFAGIKGGQASSPHGHMDVGTFVLDMMGSRFVEDLGMQDYNSLETIGMQIWDRKAEADRWKVFRISARSHNVLMVNDQAPNVDGRGEVVSSTATSAKVDLSGVYARQLARASRELRLRDDQSVAVTDEVQATNAGGLLRWAIITSAEVAIDKEGATLTRNGKQVRLRITETDDIVLQSRPADPPPAAYDARNPGKTVVWFEVNLKADERRTWTAEFARVRP